MTPEELQQAIEANTATIAQLATAVERTNQGVNFLVTEFIRPNTQQHLQSIERLERLEGIVELLAQQQQINSDVVAAILDRLSEFDVRLEETRQLVAQNSSAIAQMGARHAQLFARLDQRLDRIGQQQETNAEAIADNGQQIQALVEASRTQLAAIIGNGRRIDRLEQQAS